MNTDGFEMPTPTGEILFYQTEDGRTRLECRFEDESLWMTQAALAELYQTTPQNVTLHLKAIYADGELDQAATCKDYLQVQTEGGREVSRTRKFYSLEAILAVGYRWPMIKDALGDRCGGLALRYSVEDEPLGIGGALRRAVALASDDPVFVLNGDTFAEVDFRAMAVAHQRAGVELSMAVATLPDAARYGGLTLSEDRVVGFEPAASAAPGPINAGVYLIARRLLDDAALPERFSFERDFLAARVATLRPLAVPLSGRFIDIGVPEDISRAQTLLAG